MKKSYCLSLLVLFFITANAAPTAVQLAENGKSGWRINVPQQAGAVERFAAAELQKYLQKISGATLPYASVNTGDFLIRIGLRAQLGKIAGIAPAKKNRV